jgi:hypothetical protein
MPNGSRGTAQSVPDDTQAGIGGTGVLHAYKKQFEMLGST